MLDWLYNLLGTVIYGFSYILGGKYVFGLLLYALMFKLLFLPFTIKQQKNQIKMAALTPKIAIIKAKYKGRTDRVTQQKMQEEIMALQQKEGYSPFSGCLPMLIQLPIIIFLYNVIRNPLSHICRLSEEAIVSLHEIANGLTEAVAFKSIDQIALISKIEEAGLDIMAYGAHRALPDFHLFGLNLANTPSFANFGWLVLIPILAAASQWFTMWVTRKISGNGAAAQLQSEDQQNSMSMRIMDITMPLMTLFFAFNFSGMLGVYWIYQSLLSILQTLILAKLMPIPKFTEEDLKKIKKAEREAEKAQKNAIKTQPRYRSLHYIDADDYDELPEPPTDKKKKKPTSGSQGGITGSDAPEIKD